MQRPPDPSGALILTTTQFGHYGSGRGGFRMSLVVKPTANGCFPKKSTHRIDSIGDGKDEL